MHDHLFIQIIKFDELFMYYNHMHKVNYLKHKEYI